MLNTMRPVSFPSPITEEGNKRLVVNGYAKGTKPTLFSRQLIDLAEKKKLEKIWLCDIAGSFEDMNVWIR